MDKVLIALVLFFGIGLFLGRLQVDIARLAAIILLGGFVISFHDALLFYAPLMKSSWQETLSTFGWLGLDWLRETLQVCAVVATGFFIGGSTIPYPSRPH